jgi:hypothetical protein
MKTIEADIFTGEYDYLVHVANLFHTWGGGFVVPLKKKYPDAYQADLATPKGESNKLGCYSSAVVNDGKLIVVNLYAQMGIGNDGNPLNRNLQYDFLYDCLYRLCEQITEEEEKEKVIIGVPSLIGCGRAGGSERIVLAILADIEEKFPKVEFNVYKL